MDEPRIVIATGGTAGHVIPALAVAAALRDDGAHVSFIGADRAEAQLVPVAGFEFHRISVEGLDRSNPLKAARSLARALLALRSSLRLLGELKPQAVLGGGGYVAGPVGLAAVLRRVPLVLTEADSHLGLTNRLLARFARRVCLSFPIPTLHGRRYLLTGRPIPFTEHDRDRSRETLGIEADERCLVVFGGSLGARSINLAAIDAFSEADFHVLHVAGRRDYPDLSSRQLRDGYDLRDYMDIEDFSRALAAADLVLARSGGSVFEIAAHGLPAILVPYPHASADHQSTNARWMADAGAAIVIEDGKLEHSQLREIVEELFNDPGRLEQMADASLSLARPEAAELIATEVLKAAGR
jgi:UDP-N-acetylglucosamine--N-acetylmuramyl-(pentapeptide) pyrophosphoryl-undecaprenol N-acetylglucosamine transferase